MKKRLLALAAGLLLLLSGCGMNVEYYLQPPRAQGEQQAVQAALDTYIRDVGGQGEQYVLKYPSEGAYTSAFVLCDEAGFPTDGRAAKAVVFYAPGSQRSETHVNLLRREGDEWVSVGDSVGIGTDIRQVAFGDLDGDGVAELVTGWSTYNSQNHRLGLFSMTAELTPLSTDRVYTRLFVGDVTDSGHDSLLLWHIGTGRHVTATLEQVADRQLVTLGSTRVDGYIQRFGEATLCDFDGVKGVMVDAAKSSGTTITELVVYHDRQLVAPLYNPHTNQTTVTGRATGLAARDIDGDGRMEIPSCRPLAGFDTGDTTALTGWLTTWRAYDYAADRWETRLHTVVNEADGYLVTLDDTRREYTTTAYDADSRTLDLLDTRAGDVWLRLCAGDGASQPEDSRQVRLTGTGNQPAYTAYYDPTVLDEEKVRYMIIRI